MFLQIYKNIFNNVSPSGFFIITAVPRSLTSVKSVDSVGEYTQQVVLCDPWILWEDPRKRTKKKDDTNHSHRPLKE